MSGIKPLNHRFTVAPMMDFSDPRSLSIAYDAPCAECVQKESAHDRTWFGEVHTMHAEACGSAAMSRRRWRFIVPTTADRYRFLVRGRDCAVRPRGRSYVPYA
jgi:hypothetical protein